MLSELATDDAYCLNLSRDSSPPGRCRNSSVYTKNLGFLGLSRPGWWRWSTLGCPDNGSSRWLDYFSEREILINYSDIVISLLGSALTQGPGCIIVKLVMDRNIFNGLEKIPKPSDVGGLHSSPTIIASSPALLTVSYRKNSENWRSFSECHAAGIVVASMGATSITPPIQSYLDKKHWEMIKRQHWKSVVDDIALLTLERLQKAADAVANGHSIDDSKFVCVLNNTCFKAMRVWQFHTTQ
jgi:hypothetical protein